MTPEQRYELEKEFVTILANYEGWEIQPESVHSRAETDPKAKRWFELARKLLDAVEQAIS
ncbi:hypothetical protein [Dendronalium sp. ChiSLP03b]|uniref:hypothetical protein n=1 Tax=Dendronalium sp. ChiSLP03b TaxID=3075381 RepID=UPI002AD522C8|nr:hypothetical protein [Dendronalium sp. ChiSLP03b]MDZ8209042.1 hypothetical protein [Dendronalium sp. ChiSLP03b]